ncbi:MAG: PQQ-binding-like beta-propeller repeat protein [Candidatus Marinimicrobia bacterium]|nr:PQQ-binding-like beta-propeller repeat protein [Candidatus Neomarinimicrobiota bacterium]
MQRRRPPYARYGYLALICLWAGCARGPRITPDELLAAYQDSGVPTSTAFLPKPELVWQTKLNSPPAALLPMGPRILLVTTHRGELYRLSMETGKRDSRIWRPMKTAITAQLVHGEGPVLYFASARDEELIAFHMGAVKKIWTQKSPGITGRMTAAGGQLLTASLTGKVAAYDTADGRLSWHRQLPGRIYRGVSVFSNLALVLDDQAYLYAFPIKDLSDASLDIAETGDPPPANYPFLWRRQLSINPTAWVSTGMGQLILADSDGRVLKVDPGSGDTIFHIQLGAPIYSQPLVTDSLVVVATGAGEVLGLRSSDGAIVWQVQGEGLVNLPLAIIGGGRPRADGTPLAVLVPFARGRLLALELATGRELWRYDLEHPIRAISVTPQGVVIVQPRRRLIYLRMYPPPGHSS